MTKRVLSLLLALTTLLSLGVPAFAAGSGETGGGEPAPAGAVEKSAPAPAQAAGVTASGTCGAEGDNLTWELTSDGVLTISGTGKMDDWVWAWKDHRFDITSVTILSGVTTIGEAAFQSCTSLKSVTIPTSVTSIGAYAFSFCESLSSVTIPTSVTSIGDVAFAGCYSLTSVTIPSSVTSIGDGVFSYCDSLTAITVAGGNKNYCSEGGVLFNKAKTELIQYPGGKSGAYSIPSGVTSIRNDAFRYCTSLSSVTIPSSVTSIGIAAFENCTSLKNVTIPGSVTSIGVGAFRICANLTAINVAGENKNYCSVGGVLFNKAKTELLQYPAGKSGAYSIPSGVTSIGVSAFNGCESLAGVTIPSSVTSIGDSAFSACASLKSVTIPGSVTSIGEYAFFCCYSLTSVTIPASVTSIGLHAFLNCSPELVISGYSGSAAETYAKENNIPFKSLGRDPDEKLPAPKLSKVENVNGGVKVTWGKVTGAAKYRVFYKPSGGSWAKAGDTTSTSYTWKGAKSGTSYQFRVWCVSADGKTQTSTYDAIKSITYVAAPNYTLSTPSTGGIKLSWSKVAGASKYTVFYKTTGDWKTLTTTANTSYTIKSPKAGTKYTFRVRCVDSAGSVVSGYIIDKTLTYQAPAKPAQLSAPKITSVTSEANGIKVTWGKVTGAEKYRVFYKPSGGSWAKAGDTTSTSYTWKGAKSGVTYQIRVWCVSADGKTQTSTYDAIKTITYKK